MPFVGSCTSEAEGGDACGEETMDYEGKCDYVDRQQCRKIRRYR